MNLVIDTHAHVNFGAFKEDADEVIKKSLGSNIWMINVGAELKTSKRAVEFAGKYSQGIFAAVGLHPMHFMPGEVSEEEFKLRLKEEKFDYQKYKSLVQSVNVVAIGEIGLDYYHLKSESPEEILKLKNLQKEIFIEQLEFAQELNKSTIIHCREAHNDLLDVLNSKFKNPDFKPRGVIHSFSGNYKQARKYREMGFKIAFNGIITFARDYDKVILDTPLEDILLETDCPYLAPVPYRGKRNEPLYVVEVAKKLAEIKNLSLEEVVNKTTDNAKKVFNLI